METFVYVVLLYIVFQKVNDSIEMVTWRYESVSLKLVVIWFV